MNRSSLSLHQTPPLSVPLRFFATAPLFGLAAAALLAWAGPAAFAARWTPAALALTHLMTLGFLTMTMAGALLQLLPVLAGAPVPRARAMSAAIHATLALGAAALSTGLLSGHTVWIHVGLALLATAAGALIAVVARALARSPSQSPAIGAMAAAIVAFTVTAALGLYLGAEFAGGSKSAAHALADLHLGWGLAGWVGLLFSGVAYEVVPMFQLTPHYPPMVTTWMTKGVFAGLLLWTAAFALAPWAAPAAGALPAAGLAAFAVVTLRLQARRRRRRPDVTLDYWRLGMACLLLAIALWALARPLSAATWVPRYQVALGVLMIVGFAVSVISGMLYKIVPFLCWLHLHHRLHTRTERHARLPAMHDFIPVPRARLQFRVQLAAVALLVAAAIHPAGLTYAAAAVQFAAFALLWINVGGAVRRYRALAHA